MEILKVRNEKKIELPKPQGHLCFACGTDNPIGFNLRFYRLGDTICSDITLGKYHVGWDNIAHGGMISTLLDETMSWTIIYFEKVFTVTRKMEIKYIKPVKIGIPLTVKGRLMKDQNNPSIIKVRAELFDDKGKILVRGIGEFVMLSDDKLSIISDNMKKEMILLFDQLASL